MDCGEGREFSESEKGKVDCGEGGGHNLWNNIRVSVINIFICC